MAESIKSKYRFLALDGGGVRGIHTCEVLDFFCDKHEGFIEKFDAIAGTSTGSLIACGLAFGMNPKEIKKLYYDIAPKVFQKTSYLPKPLHFFWGTPYSLENAKVELKKVFGNATLSDLNKRVLVTSWDLDARPNVDRLRKCGMKRHFRKSSGKFWNNLHSTEAGGSAKIYHVLLTSIAAPTYFEPYKNHYMDGGLIQNSPGLPLVFQALCEEGEFTAKLDEIYLLSLGTSGKPVFFDRNKRRNWGLQNWVRTLSNALTDSNMDFSEYGLQSLLGNRYYRFAPYVGLEIGLDEFQKMQALETQTRKYLNNLYVEQVETATRIDKWISHMLENSNEIAPELLSQISSLNKANLFAGDRSN